MKPGLSTKRGKINKAKSTTVMVVAGAVAVIVFSLVSAKALVSQAAYHRRVIHARKDAVKQLKANLSAANQLSSQYTNVFESGTTNVIGGRNTPDPNVNPPDGDNARVTLDALPSSYDFPALISSMSKILQNNGVNDPGMTGTDDSQNVDSTPSGDPKYITIPISVSGVSNYTNIQKVIKDLERSIRPFDITTMTLTGTNSTLNMSMTMNTYFQPGKSLDYTTKVVK